MTDLHTARLHLPLLAPGQAQKELTHNEALTLVDILTNPVVENATTAVPPPNPGSDQSWLVAPDAAGAWAGQSSRIAAFTVGGWRFVSPYEGMIVWDKATGKQRRFHSGQWITPNNFTLPSGGTVVDQEARAAIGNVAALLANWGLA